MSNRPLIICAFLLFSFTVVIARLGVQHQPTSPVPERKAMAYDNCTNCGNGDSCCGSEICCNSTSLACCSSNAVCCNDTCCESDELCCPDEKYGSICCITETTFCCPPAFGNPSHCCPRWMVCCEFGSYGCCDPATGKPMEATTTAWALYIDNEGNFASMSIDLTTGDHVTKSVSGFNDYDETTRVFAFDEKRTLFYLLQGNFTVDTQEHVITLYIVDPVAATTKSVKVQGATEEGINDVSGFAYLESKDVLIMSTQKVNKQQQVTAYNFYTVDPSTGVATYFSTCDNFTVDQYCGWFDEVSSDGTMVYRLGYQDVVHSQGFGLGITDLSQSSAIDKFYGVPLAKGYDNYVSLSLINNGFISLSPNANYGNLAVVKWALGGNATVLFAPSDAYVTPIFGPLVEYVNDAQDTYAALVVYDSDIDDNLDRWAVMVVDLQTGSAQELVLWPWVIAKISSMSGFGFSSQ